MMMMCVCVCLCAFVYVCMWQLCAAFMRFACWVYVHANRLAYTDVDSIDHFNTQVPTERFTSKLTVATIGRGHWVWLRMMNILHTQRPCTLCSPGARVSRKGGVVRQLGGGPWVVSIFDNILYCFTRNFGSSARNPIPNSNLGKTRGATQLYRRL